MTRSPVVIGAAQAGSGDAGGPGSAAQVGAGAGAGGAGAGGGAGGSMPGSPPPNTRGEHATTTIPSPATSHRIPVTLARVRSSVERPISD
jgi:hypothetical protein